MLTTSLDGILAGLFLVGMIILGGIIMATIDGTFYIINAIKKHRK